MGNTATPVASVSGANLSAGTTYYGAMGMGQAAFQSTSETITQVPFFTDGILSTLSVRVVSNNRTTNSVITVRKNGADGNQTVTIPATTTGEFIDLTHTDVIAPNDLLNYKVVVGTGGTGFVAVSYIVRYENTASTPVCVTKCLVSIATASATVGASQTLYAPVAGMVDTAWATTESDVAFQLQVPLTLASIWVRVGANSRSDDTSLIFRANGTNIFTATITPTDNNVIIKTNPGAKRSSNQQVDWQVIIGAGTGTIEIIAFGCDLTDASQFSLIAGYTPGISVGLIGPQYTSLAGLASITTTSTAFLQRMLQSVLLSNLEIVIKTNGYTATAAFLQYMNSGTAGGAVLVGIGATGILIDTTNTIKAVASDVVQGQIVPSASGTTMVFTVVGILATLLTSDPGMKPQRRFFQQIQHH